MGHTKKGRRKNTDNITGNVTYRYSPYVKHNGDSVLISISHKNLHVFKKSTKEDIEKDTIKAYKSIFP